MDFVLADERRKYGIEGVISSEFRVGRGFRLDILEVHAENADNFPSFTGSII
jgi:hypothetical protein